MKKIIYLISLSFLLMNCSSNDDSNNFNDPNDLDGTFMSAKINGSPFLAQQGELGFDTVNGFLFDNELTGFGLAISGADIQDNGTLVGLSFGIGGENFSGITNGFEISVQEDDNYFVDGGYNLITAQGEESDFSFDTESIYIKINFIDKEAGIISGEFNYTITDFISGQTFEITEGVFNEVNYTTN